MDDRPAAGAPEPPRTLPDDVPVLPARRVGTFLPRPGLWEVDATTGGRARTWVDPGRRRIGRAPVAMPIRDWQPLPASLELDPSLGPWDRPILVADDPMTTVAVRDLEGWAVHTSSGVVLRRAAKPGWDSSPGLGRPHLAGVFLGDHLWLVERTGSPDRNTLVVIDPVGWQVVATLILASDRPEGFGLFPHPTGDGLVVNAGRGQDGTDLWLVRLTATGLDVRGLPDAGRMFGSFLDHGRILLLPHTSDSVDVVSWPDGEVVSRVRSADVLVAAPDGTIDHFLYDGFAPDGRHAVLLTYGGRLVIVDLDRSAAVAEVRVPGFGWTGPHEPPTPDLSSIRPLGGTWFVADHEQRLDWSIWSVPMP